MQIDAAEPIKRDNHRQYRHTRFWMEQTGSALMSKDEIETRRRIKKADQSISFNVF